MSGEINKDALEAAEKAVEQRGEESLTDIAPTGALMIGKYPARALSAADFKICQRVMRSCEASGMDLDDADVAVLIIYCLVQVDASQIAQLWRDAHSADELWGKIVLWMAEFSATELSEMVVHAAPLLEEFRDTAAVVESGGTASGE